MAEVLREYGRIISIDFIEVQSLMINIMHNKRIVKHNYKYFFNLNKSTFNKDLGSLEEESLIHGFLSAKNSKLN